MVTNGRLCPIALSLLQIWSFHVQGPKDYTSLVKFTDFHIDGDIKEGCTDKLLINHARISQGGIV